MGNLQSLKLIVPVKMVGFFSHYFLFFPPIVLFLAMWYYVVVIVFSGFILLEVCSYTFISFSFKNFQQFFSVYISAEIFHLSSDFSDINVRPSNIPQISEVLFILFNFFHDYSYWILHMDLFSSLLTLFCVIFILLLNPVCNFFRYFDFSSGVFLFSFFSLSVLFVLVGSIYLLQTFIFLFT